MKEIRRISAYILLESGDWMEREIKFKNNQDFTVEDIVRVINKYVKGKIANIFLELSEVKIPCQVKRSVSARPWLRLLNRSSVNILSAVISRIGP